MVDSYSQMIYGKTLYLYYYIASQEANFSQRKN